MLRGVKILNKTIDKRRQSLSGGSDFNKWWQLCLRKDTVPSVCGVLGLKDPAVLQSPKPQPPQLVSYSFASLLTTFAALAIKL